MSRGVAVQRDAAVLNQLDAALGDRGVRSDHVKHRFWFIYLL
jgi:hypothetical protein